MSRLRLTLVLAGLLACSDAATGPPGPVSVTIGDSIVVELAAGASTELTFHAQQRRSHLAFLATTGGTVRLVVRDSATGDSLTGATAAPGVPLLDNPSPYFRTVSGGAYLLRVTAGPAAATAIVYLAVAPAAPEGVPPELAYGDTVDGERLDDAEDLDLFWLPGAAGDSVIIYAQVLDGQDTQQLRVELFDSTEALPLLSLPVAPTGTDLEAATQSIAVLPQAGHYRLEVAARTWAGAPPGLGVGRYRFAVHRVRSAPEEGVATFAIGDTVVSVLEHAGDIDDFRFTGASGTVVNVFAQSLADTAGRRPAFFLHFKAVVAPFDHAAAATSAVAGDTGLYSAASGRAVLPHAGMNTIRVQRFGPGVHRGRYRFVVFPIDQAPERSSVTVNLGDSVIDETLDPKGDIDTFRLVVPTTTYLNIGYAIRPGSQGMRFEGPGVTLLPTPPPADTVAWTGASRLAAGSYRIQAYSDTSGSAARPGRYSIRTIAIDSAPEHGPMMFAPGDTVHDRIDRPGDLDVFTFTARRGQLARMSLWTTGSFAAGNPVLYAEGLTNLDGSSAPGGFVTSLPFTIRADSVLTVRLSTRYSGRDPRETGSYAFTVGRVVTTPEQVPATLIAGDSVTAEAIDFPGDIDDFLVAVPPGHEANAFVRRVSGGGSIWVRAIGDTAWAVDSIPSFGPREWTGRFATPVTGTLRLRVNDASACPSVETCPGFVPTMYVVGVRVVDRAPEAAAVMIAPGDTVRSERLDHEGDIDEFLVAAGVGDTLQAFFDTPQGIGAPALLEVIGPSGVLLGSVVSWNPAPSLGAQTTGPIAVSSIGPYMIRVRGTDDRAGAGPYTMLVTRRP